MVVYEGIVYVRSLTGEVLLREREKTKVRYRKAPGEPEDFGGLRFARAACVETGASLQERLHAEHVKRRMLER